MDDSVLSLVLDIILATEFISIFIAIIITIKDIEKGKDDDDK